MKNANIFLVITFFIFHPFFGQAQTLNWERLKNNQRHIINLHAGVEHGTISGAGYSYQLKARVPVLLGAEYSFPGGKKLVDDFKTKIGGQIRFYQTGNIHFSARFYGVFRRYENDFVRLLDFGSDFSAAVGYYRQKWFIAGEAGFDKAVITHFKHAETYKALYPMVKDGWYEPATGGNFYYGLQTGYSFRKTDIYVKAGKIITQDFKTEPLIPFSFQLGFNRKLQR